MLVLVDKNMLKSLLLQVVIVGKTLWLTMSSLFQSLLLFDMNIKGKLVSH